MKGGRNKYSEREGGSDPAWRVVIAIGPSRQVVAFVMALASTAMACVLLSGLDGFPAAAACPALAVAAVVALRREALREGRGAVRRLVVDVDGRIETTESEGATMIGRVSAGSFVAPWLTVVRWRPEGARFARTVLVLPDAVDSGAFRRLRVLLRWGTQGGRCRSLAV